MYQNEANRNVWYGINNMQIFVITLLCHLLLRLKGKLFGLWSIPLWPRGVINPKQSIAGQRRNHSTCIYTCINLFVPIKIEYRYKDHVKSVNTVFNTNKQLSQLRTSLYIMVTLCNVARSSFRAHMVQRKSTCIGPLFTLLKFEWSCSNKIPISGVFLSFICLNSSVKALVYWWQCVHDCVCVCVFLHGIQCQTCDSLVEER